ncbi:MAG: nitrite reductase (NAD(P)H) small subunit, partial [Corynebacterium sp.]|nr:nitrite reductase (NAD(P)H) small subunit [Corynebacterium sp.]
FRAGSTVSAVSKSAPYLGGAVISWVMGGVGEGVARVASPLLKQRFRLSDGQSLEDDGNCLATYAVRLDDDEAGALAGGRRVQVCH